MAYNFEWGGGERGVKKGAKKTRKEKEKKTKSMEGKIN